MSSDSILKDKVILVVDDEPDVLEAIADELDMCIIHKAQDYNTALQSITMYTYDVVILDIMGVQGFDLLKVANGQGIPALMLTAHALTEESLEKSVKGGAAYFAPKEKMADIEVFVADVFEAIAKKKNPWERLLDRLGGYYDKKFQGQGWREQEDKFLKKKINKFV